MLEIVATKIPDVKLIKSRRFLDARGFFTETYNRKSLVEVGIELDFVQENHSYSRAAGTIRGMHFQAPPFAQGKLVRVVRGRILDVTVDLRRSARTFGQHVDVELSAEEGWQLLVPTGFAHGFCTLEPDTDVVYKVTSQYSVEHEHGLAWDDPALAISWPLDTYTPVLSDKDRCYPHVTELPHYFD